MEIEFTKYSVVEVELCSKETEKEKKRNNKKNNDQYPLDNQMSSIKMIVSGSAIVVERYEDRHQHSAS